MTKTSHKKNRPFNFKLIDLVEPHTILYSRIIPGMSSFEIMKTKNLRWQEIATEMGYSAQFCMSRWANLRRRYQRELERNTELCTQTGVIRISHWPYLERLKFLDRTFQPSKPKQEKPEKRKQKQKIKVKNQDVFLKEESSDTHFSEDYDHVFNAEDHISSSNIAKEVTKQEDKGSMENFHQIQALLCGFEGDNLKRIERRLMAFLCKCQLRAFGKQTIDDLCV